VAHFHVFVFFVFRCSRFFVFSFFRFFVFSIFRPGANPKTTQSGIRVGLTNRYMSIHKFKSILGHTIGILMCYFGAILGHIASACASMRYLGILFGHTACVHIYIYISFLNFKNKFDNFSFTSPVAWACICYLGVLFRRSACALMCYLGVLLGHTVWIPMCYLGVLLGHIAWVPMCYLQLLLGHVVDSPGAI